MTRATRNWRWRRDDWAAYLVKMGSRGSDYRENQIHVGTAGGTGKEKNR